MKAATRPSAALSSSLIRARSIPSERRRIDPPEASMTRPRGSRTLRRKLAVPVVLVTAAIVAGCGEEDHGSGGSAAPDPAREEFDICTEQADRIAETQGADAGSAALDQCVEDYGNEAQVEP